MHIRPNTLVADDLDDIHVTASSAEPMRRADHKSKKHGRPARKGETLGGGHFVFRRHADGRIHPRQDPFEHRTIEEATTEMQRLVELTGERFEVFSRSVVGGVKWEAVDEALDDALGAFVEALAAIGPVDDCPEYYESMLDRKAGAA